MKMNLAAATLLAVSVCAAIPSNAQSPFVASRSAQYVPQLSAIMTSAQIEHLKLWSAGSARNWPLAAYELLQLRESLAEAATLYSGIPVSNITTLASSVNSISKAVDNKDLNAFTKEFGELTKGCNACHQSMDRAFIAIRTPTEQPFANQAFAPRKP